MPTLTSSIEAAAARDLCTHGLVVLDLSPAGVEVAVSTDADRRAYLSLGSLRRVLSMAPAAEHSQRVAAWAKEAAAVLHGHAPSGPITERLVPRLLGRADPKLWTAQLAPGLHFALAEDLPGRQRLLTPFDIPRLGLSLADARAVAVANLAHATPPPVGLDEPVGALTWRVGDGLDAARLLLTGAGGPDTPGALAVAPARDLCWWVPVQGPDSVRAGVRLWLAARNLGSLPYPLSDTLWWVHPNGIAPVEIHVERGTIRVVTPPALAERLQ